MAKLRSLSTSFWSDPFVEDLTPNQKLLFLYLITNERTNMLGIYESSIKKISFETGIKKDDVSNGLEAFQRLGKVKYINNYVILTNYMKHQNYNTNMKKSAIDVYNVLPKELKSNNLDINKSNPSEGFESLLNYFGMVSKIEVECEEELEEEGKEKEEEEEQGVFSFYEFWELYPKKVQKKDCESKFNKLTNEDKRKIKDTLVLFLNHKPFPEYTHPNPATYLNQKRWHDEIGSAKTNIKPLIHLSWEASAYLTDDLKHKVQTGQMPEEEALQIQLAKINKQ